MIRLTTLFLCVSVLLGIIGFIRVQPGNMELGKIYSTSDLEIPLYELYDLGVADINSNSYYDIFTVNHSARQAILINNGNGGFTNKIEALGLEQDSLYSNIEDSDIAPEFKNPGIYLYRKHKKLHLVSWKLKSQFKVTLHLPWPIAVIDSKDTQYALSKSKIYSSELPNTRLDISIKKNGSIVIVGEQNILELPHQFEIHSGAELASIFIGKSYSNPKSHLFTLHWRDRHAMAWTDIDNNGTTDVLIARGGVKGQLNVVAVDISDQILLNDGKTFKDRSNSYLLKKGNCPARQAAWVDHDNNGLIDAHIACGRHNIEGYPNILLSQKRNGLFSETASSKGLDFDRISVFKWLDSDRDGDMDLIAVESNELVHYLNDKGVFSKVILAKSLLTDFYQLSVADFDQDGFFDLYAVSRTESKIIKNNSGKLSVEDPTIYGLPNRSRSAAWIDHNNNGLLDLHTVPEGIFAQTDTGKFSKSGLLDTNENLNVISQARCSWFDIENNGSLDAICAIQRNYPKEIRVTRKLINQQAETRYWIANKIINKSNSNSWLHLDLKHLPGNPQAIGAVVSIKTNGKKQYRTVGEYEGSHYSQGHYRLYFGLGNSKVVDELTVFWPDNSTTRLFDIKTNQLLKISNAIQ